MSNLGFTHKVDESLVREIVNDMYINHPDKIDNIIKYYSRISGISLEYVDLTSAVRGLISST